MACNVQDWSMRDLADALNDKHKDKKRIAVPTFQRGTRWTKHQELTFIDSLKKGYPVGTMLFYETVNDNITTYILVDGLQRGNSIRKYINKPTEYFLEDTISPEFCSELLETIGECVCDTNVGKVKNCLYTFVKEQNSYENLQYFKPAKQVLEIFDKTDISLIERAIPIFQEYFSTRQRLYTKIANTMIPVVVYTGPEENLTEIFSRINSKGTPLTQYEIYAAAWPVEKRVRVDNHAIVNAVVRKYKSFDSEDIPIYGFDHNLIAKEHKLTAFEYLFGLGKFLTSEFDMLGFRSKNEADDETNKLGFELVNACLNSSDKISELYNNILSIGDINVFERSLLDSIDFVSRAIAPVTKFKGNTHTQKRMFHTKFSIMSMIAATFKEMHHNGDFAHVAPSWKEVKDSFQRNILHYYIFDILTDFWSDGGTGKIYSVMKPNRYLGKILPASWNSAIDGYFARTLQRTEKKKVANPGSDEFVFLNCIYLKTFDAMDQLSTEKFDVEHIAPKARLKTILDQCKGEGLPISCIANLCYLPEYVNRSKSAKTLYQDASYLKKINLTIADIESKYSFTNEKSLEFLDMPFGDGDFDDLKEWYLDFLSERFAVLKRKFCDSLGITLSEEVESIPTTKEVESFADSDSPNIKTKKKNALVYARAVENLQAKMSSGAIEQISYRMCRDASGVVYLFQISKPFKRKDGSIYWYAYRPETLKNCDEAKDVKLCFVFADDGKCIALSKDEIESHLKELHESPHGDGTSHWHIKFFRNADGRIVWMLGHEGKKGKKIEVLPLF